jgi:hypothetical protein
MVSTQNSIMNLLIAKDVARTASATALDILASTYLVDGEIAVVDLSGTVLDTTTVQSVSQIRIVQSQGAALPSIQSPVIELAGVKSYKSKVYSAPTQQVDYIGYNAITLAGDIDIINSNGYEIMIHDVNSAAYGSTGVSKFGFYVSDATATKAEINDGLAVSLYQNIARVIRKPFLVERLSAATFTQSTAATGTATYTNGSVVVTTSGATPATDFPVGSYVRIGTTATSTLTLPVYKVVAVSNSAQTITLDQPIQGVSGTGATTAFAFAVAATVNASALGIRLTGIAAVFTSPQSTEPYINRWITSVRNAGVTPVVAQVGALEGIGSYPVVASLEYFLIGNEGFISRNDIPYVAPRANALSAGTYHFITLEWDSVKSGHIFNQQAASKQLLLALNFVAASAPTSIVGAASSVQDVLNAWISSSVGTGTLA